MCRTSSKFNFIEFHLSSIGTRRRALLKCYTHTSNIRKKIYKRESYLYYLFLTLFFSYLGRCRQVPARIRISIRFGEQRQDLSATPPSLPNLLLSMLAAGWPPYLCFIDTITVTVLILLPSWSKVGGDRPSSEKLLHFASSYSLYSALLSCTHW